MKCGGDPDAEMKGSAPVVPGNLCDVNPAHVIEKKMLQITVGAPVVAHSTGVYPAGGCAHREDHARASDDGLKRTSSVISVCETQKVPDSLLQDAQPLSPRLEPVAKKPRVGAADESAGDAVASPVGDSAEAAEDEFSHPPTDVESDDGQIRHGDLPKPSNKNEEFVGVASGNKDNEKDYLYWKLLDSISLRNCHATVI